MPEKSFKKEEKLQRLITRAKGGELKVNKAQNGKKQF